MKKHVMLVAIAVGMVCVAGYSLGWFGASEADAAASTPQADPGPPPVEGHGCAPGAKASCASLLQPYR